jgi:tyrosinase
VFLDGHNTAADGEIHGRPSFLPWHRAFILDLERRLQKEDSSVTLPYWRFELTAPNVFISEFMGGSPNSAGRVDLSASNPLQSWTIGATPGIFREPNFNTSNSAPSLNNEIQTLALGTIFSEFRRMEGNPHGSAHVAFSGRIRSPSTATQDPLFFMLHCNVDRLWAKWQLANNRFDPTNVNAYSGGASPRAGDAPTDTMWPWNDETGGTRPPTAPGDAFPQLSFTSKPSPSITVAETIDYIGRVEGNELHFDYDDVPYM